MSNLAKTIIEVAFSNKSILKIEGKKISKSSIEKYLTSYWGYTRETIRRAFYEIGNVLVS